MHFKIKSMKNNPEGGFVLVLALIGIMILMAIGYLALMISTSDLRVAARLVGERKALSAAEAGVHAAISNYSSAPSTNNVLNVAVDPVNDPHSFYDVTNSAEVAGLSQACTGAFSIEGGVSWHCKNFSSVITGRNTVYDSRVSIAIGVKGKAAPDTPGYDFN